MMAFAAFPKRALSMFGRVFPRCGMISQAIAFNLFLAFFPALLIAVGVATSPIGGRTSLFDLITGLTSFLPPGSHPIVAEFLVKRGPDAWKWTLIGLGGTLLAGTQVMKLLMEGIHIIYGDRERPGFLGRQLRALALLVLTIAPLLAAATLGVFGRPLRRWLAYEFGRNASAQFWWVIFFHGIAILLAMSAVIVIYRWARPHQQSLAGILPGAILATLLWWTLDVSFGFYMRRMQYNIIYGGLGAVIGLLVWMQLSTVIIFLGAAWNAEREASRAVPG
jgi:YihY family inner membrane protein